ncbi:MAG: hypothetical protein AB7O67_01840 [Vicinamibacterales bacterium]
MQFAVLLPWWGYVVVFALVLALAWASYARVAAAMTPGQRLALTGLRAAALVLVTICLLRPVVFEPAAEGRDAVVPILVDTSRSMRLADAGAPRIEQAAGAAVRLREALARDYRVELLAFGENVAAAEDGQFAAAARRSDLSSALASLAERYRGVRLGGIVVLSDGGDTSEQEAGQGTASPARVFTIGVGGRGTARDREVLNLTAGDPVLANSSVDLSVSAVSRGFGTEPIELRVSANGRPVEVRHVTPDAEGAPVHEVFTVSPDPETPTVFTVEIPPVDGELAAENNRRSVLVPAEGRKRRVLMVEGAPGHEHTFLRRALAGDPGLDVDAVVRKGRNDEGRDTFLVQAAASRAPALADGLPATHESLFAYDALLLGNIEGDVLTREQLDAAAAFVGQRGGGLLVLGARSFDRGGFTGTALEEVLPLDLTDRRGAVARAADVRAPAPNHLALTPDGGLHPATRLAVSPQASREKWAALPPLAAVTDVGGPRPGAQVLAVSSAPGGVLKPLLAAQRYGQGRALVFAGEASWRWRMELPAADSTYETAWRQMVRWLSRGAPDPIMVQPPAVALPGTTGAVSVLVRDAAFEPIGGAEVRLQVEAPGGERRTVTAALTSPSEGRYTAAVRFEEAGVYRLTADVLAEGSALGSASRAALVGGADLEMAEPRLNDAVLTRIASASGGTYLPLDEVDRLPGLLEQADATEPPMVMRDVWNNGWALLAVLALLAGEWILRRQVGLA